MLHKGHPGILRMKAAVRAIYWWPGANRQVEVLVRSCIGCQRSQKSKPPTGQEEVRIPAPNKPEEQYAIDITGPFYNGRSLVVLIDYFSHYPEVLDTTDTTSKRLIRWLQEIFDRNGNPAGLISDNGPQFVSKEFRDFLKQKDIHHFTTSVYNPQENGLVEVFNKYIKCDVQAFHSTGTSWTEGIRDLVIGYRFTPTGKGPSPADLFFGKKCRPDGVPNMTKPRRKRLEDTKPMKNKTERQSFRKEPFLGHSVFKKGDQVLCQLPQVPKGHSPYSEPKTVVEVLGTYTFLLSDGQVWPARKLKKWNNTEYQMQILGGAQWIEDDDEPRTNEQHTSPVRRTQRPNKGIPPQRFSPGVEVMRRMPKNLECRTFIQWPQE